MKTYFSVADEDVEAFKTGKRAFWFRLWRVGGHVDHVVTNGGQRIQVFYDEAWRADMAFENAERAVAA